MVSRAPAHARTPLADRRDVKHVYRHVYRLQEEEHCMHRWLWWGSDQSLVEDTRKLKNPACFSPRSPLLQCATHVYFSPTCIPS